MIFKASDLEWPHNSFAIQNIRKRGGIEKTKIYFQPNFLIYSQLSYSHLVWGTTTKTNISKLYELRKRAVRAIANLPYLHHTKNTFTYWNMTHTQDSYTKRFLLLCDSTLKINSISFLGLTDLLRRLSTYNFRNQQRWRINQSRTHYFGQSVYFDSSTI